MEIDDEGLFWICLFLVLSVFRSGIPKKGEARVLYGLDREYPAVAVVNLGPDPGQQKDTFVRENELEDRDMARENVRSGIAGKTHLTSSE